MSRKQSNPKRTVTEKTHAEDEKLRDELRRADLKKFDKALAKAFDGATKK